MSLCGNNSVHGERSRYLKFFNGNLVAVEGSNILETLILSDLRIPYRQLLKSRVILKSGQKDYLLNHLGLGDNATFLIIKATYNEKSKREEDNFVNWRFFDSGIYEKSLKELLLLTGNSEKRIKQIYLTNPNDKWEVQLDILVAVIDDQFNFFTDESQQTGVTILNMDWTRIKTYKVGESIQIMDNNDKAIVFIRLINIKSFTRSGKLVIIEDNSIGNIYLDHTNDLEAAQTGSLLNLLVTDNTIDTVDIVEDKEPPVLTFYENWGNTQSGATISAFGLTQTPVSSTMSLTFSTTAPLVGGDILKEDLVDNLVFGVIDNRDGPISLGTDNIIIETENGTLNKITATGSYDIRFNIEDIALNNLNNIKLILNVI
jgi:hypothetical protein